MERPYRTAMTKEDAFDVPDAQVYDRVKRHASEQPLDLMVTDHMMPGMTGLELAAASRKVRPSLPVLLATGYAELPEGAQLDLPRLAKPYHQDQLRDQLDQLLA